MKKFKITETQLNSLIKEEYGKMKQKKSIEAQIAKTQAQINTLNESINLDEVEAGAETKTQSAGWSGTDGDVKYDEKFEKIGTHLKEDMGLEMDVDVEGGEEEASMEIDADTYEAMFAKIGAMLDAKLGLEGGEDMEGDMEGDMEADMEVTNDDEEEVAIDMGASEEGSEEGAEEDEEMMAEQDGETVVNDAPQDTVNDNMEKVNNNNAEADKMYEGTENGKEVITEGKAAVKNILAEGMNKAQSTKLDQELAKMARFAKI